jgi:hypothetical protein
MCICAPGLECVHMRIYVCYVHLGVYMHVHLGVGDVMWIYVLSLGIPHGYMSIYVFRWVYVLHVSYVLG